MCLLRFVSCFYQLSLCKIGVFSSLGYSSRFPGLQFAVDCLSDGSASCGILIASLFFFFKVFHLFLVTSVALKALVLFGIVSGVI